MKALNITVERTGFPVSLAGLDFFFDCSAEHIEEYEVKYTEVERKLKELEDDGDIESKKEALGLGYDVMLGEGAFKKLYEKVPDLIAWINAFFDLAGGIAQNINEFKNDQENKSKDLEKKYLKKKAIKKG
ncbi:hypothetical protein SAMN04487821_11020 [Enterococcus malodoratus]|uniref:DUF6673 family protein n=1 Tax=Enterococcus malodoratus TaxID=71451 RepID=UPI0008BBC174|nr:DUF6673 family protein [Enterococcus malodoratus]SET33295.1 hypothetical protein SAMN04487821_11020 [Enterococcus malodoratus]